MNDFHFLHPLWLLAIIPVLLLWWGFLRAQAARNSAWADVIDPHLLSHLLVKAGPRSRLRPVHVLATMMALSAVALAGPSFRLQPSPFIDDEAGLMIALKVTPTMNSEDVQPSRLTRAKQKVHDLIESRRGSSTGLIVYSGTAHLVMPLTKDSTIITTMIEDLGPETMPQDGDALASALNLANKSIIQTGQPGSILVIADAVAPSQVSSAPQETDLPVQFLSISAPGAPIDTELAQLASSMNADLTELTADTVDIERIASRAKNSMRTVMQNEEGQEWVDDGYLLLPLIAFFCLFWFRKGWVIR